MPTAGPYFNTNEPLQVTVHNTNLAAVRQAEDYEESHLTSLKNTYFKRKGRTFYFDDNKETM